VSVEEFTTATAERASQARNRFGAYALGMLAGHALNTGRSFPPRFIEQAEACNTMEDTDALDREAIAFLSQRASQQTAYLEGQGKVTDALIRSEERKLEQLEGPGQTH
jgi:hypothetical protein